MRIAYVINSVEGGGAALPVPAITQVMRDQGATVEVFALTRRDGRAIKAMSAAGLRVHVRPGGETDHLAAASWLTSKLAAERPDLIWTSLTRATLIGQLVGGWLGVPVVSWQHAAFLKRANLLLLRARRRRSILWVADSHCVADLTRERLGVSPERLAVWPLFAADPHAPRARPWTPGELIRIGTLGRLHPVKGHDVLLAALVRMRDQGFRAAIEVSIAGEGAQRGALAGAIATYGLDFVRLPGFVDNPRDFLAKLHLYVQPSRSEGLCIAVHEAMQASLPTVVSAVGELPYSVEDRVTGAVVPPDDPDCLADALVRMLSQPERLAVTGAAARARVLEQFGAAAFARAGAEVIARLPSPADAQGGQRRRSTDPVAIVPPVSRRSA
jgi:glycosyltransferase involved in cell wall biosynthesis